MWLRALRDRRDQYTKSLEQELGRCRANEATLVRQVENLRATVEMLCSSFGVEVPNMPYPDTTYSSGASPLPSSTDGRSKEQTQQKIATSSWLNFDGNNLSSPTSTTPWTSPGSLSDNAGSANGLSPFDHQHYRNPSSTGRDYSVGHFKDTETSLESPTRLKDLDLVTVGMEFVLS